MLADVESEDFEEKEETAFKDTKRKLPYKESLSKKSRLDKKEEILLDSAIAYMSTSSKSTSNDEHDVFGKYIASELRSIKEARVQRWIKWSIQNTLYTAQCGMTPPTRPTHQMPFSPGSSYSMTPSPTMGSFMVDSYTTY